MLKLFLTQMDRTILDSFSHANIGPRETKAGRLLLEAEKELENAVPNLSFKYDEDITPDDFALKAIDCAMHSAKPSFANHKMFKSELGENYVIASCYNGFCLAAVRIPSAVWSLETLPREQRTSRISKNVNFHMYWISWLVTWMQESSSR